MKKIYSIADRIIERNGELPKQSYFTVNEVVKLAGVTDRTIKSRIKDGTLKAKKISGEWRIYPDSLKAAPREPEREPAAKQSKPKKILSHVELVDLKTRVTPEQKEYIGEISWQNRTTVTAYIQTLIAEDMKKHPKWRAGLDALKKEKTK